MSQRRIDYVAVTAAGPISFVLTTADASRLAILNCHHINATACTTTALGWVHLVGGDGIKIHDCIMIVNRPNHASSGVVVALGTATTNISIMRNILYSATTGTSIVALSLVASSTGVAGWNYCCNIGKTAIAGSVGIANCVGVNNYAGKTVTKCGLLDPVVDA
jgi:hypothetical protein